MVNERDEEGDLRKIFREFQRSEKAGRIFFDDLLGVVEEFGLDYDENKCRELFDAIDTEGIGSITEAQFINFIMGEETYTD